MSQVFDGVFLDGQTAAKLPVKLAAEGTGLVLQWEQGQRQVLAHEVMPIQPCRRGVQFLRLVDGGTCEMVASPELLALLAQAGVGVQKESAMAAVLHGDWRIAAMALAFLVGMVTAFYVWLLPSVADFASDLVPISLQRRLGETALRQVKPNGYRPHGCPQTNVKKFRRALRR